MSHAITPGQLAALPPESQSIVKALIDFYEWRIAKPEARVKELEDLDRRLFRGASGDFGQRGAQSQSKCDMFDSRRIWSQEYETWSHRNLSAKRYLYLWADGIYVNVRLEDDANCRQCLLVLMGATSEGKKELIADPDCRRNLSKTVAERLFLRR
jgi:Transposase, Mutator family